MNAWRSGVHDRNTRVPTSRHLSRVRGENRWNTASLECSTVLEVLVARST